MLRLRGTREAVLSSLVALAVLVLFGELADVAAVRRLELASIDLRFRWRGLLPAGDQVALVMVDDVSLAALGRWPLNRHLFAEAVRTLHRAGAKVIAFDVLFPELDEVLTARQRQALSVAAASLPTETSAELRPVLEQMATDDPDADLAHAIREAGDVLLPFTFSFTGASGQAPDSVAASAFVRFDKSDEKSEFDVPPLSIAVPVAHLAEAAAGLGHVNILYDVDNSPRDDHAAFPFDGDFYPSLAVRATADYLAIPWKDVGLALGHGLQIGPVSLPTDRAMRFPVNYPGPTHAFPSYSFVDLLHGKIPADAFGGRIVLIGASFVGDLDSVATPFSRIQPGVERIADVITTILDRRFIIEPSVGWWFGLRLILLGLAATMGWLMAWMRSRAAFVVALVPLAGWLAAAQLAFERGIVIPLAGPVLALTLAGASVVLFRYWVADRDGRLVRQQFSRYLAPQMVDILARNPARLKLGGETRTMTFLFCDIRGFTSISEQYENRPQDLTRLINRFLTPMTEIIMARGGTIDKYMGDCIMAFWNAPLDDAGHADHACDSALAMRHALDRLNQELAAEAIQENRAHQLLRVGIGINSGTCIVGNMGSEHRLDYTVLGDAVNLASRLEGQSKYYGIDIVIGEATRVSAPGYAALELDRIAVKGKQAPVRVFALLGDAALAGSAGFAGRMARHEHMLSLYRARDWEAAATILDACVESESELTATYDLYQARIRYFRANPVADDWNGVFVATSK